MNYEKFLHKAKNEDLTNAKTGITKEDMEQLLKILN
jgi:hypothetical protein